ncbi:MAG: hypothetical protein GY711_21255 [bacterium]|nr:hypothetical protein [bacterium]
MNLGRNIIVLALVAGAGCTSAPEARNYRCVRKNAVVASYKTPIALRGVAVAVAGNATETAPRRDASAAGAKELPPLGELLRCLLDPNSPLALPLGLFVTISRSVDDAPENGARADI